MLLLPSRNAFVWLNFAAPCRNLSSPHLPFCAPVAQLDRASGYEPEGREFDSLRARHFPNKNALFGR